MPYSPPIFVKNVYSAFTALSEIHSTFPSKSICPSIIPRWLMKLEDGAIATPSEVLHMPLVEIESQFFGTSDLSLRMHYSRRTGFILVVMI